MPKMPWYMLVFLLTCLMKVTEVQAQCPRPVVGENIIMAEASDLQTYPNGSIITYKCSTGYTPVVLSASKTITCVGTNWTNLELTCRKKSCGTLPDFPNGKYIFPDGILFGATAVAQCNEGYNLLGQGIRNCRDSGWDGRDPVCDAVKCSPPSAIPNGQFDPVEEIYVYNQAVTYTCQDTYTLDGAETITCSVNGTFVPAPPRCVFVRCESPDIKNAVRVEGTSPPYGYKEFVKYQCIQGYTMVGDAYLVCEINGWNPDPPVCLSQCDHPVPGPNMIMVNVSDQQKFLNGSTVTFKCSTGYQPVDPSASKTITCVGTQWTDLGLSCTKKSCGPLPDFPNGKYTYPNGVLFGATAVVQCNEGYNLIGPGIRNCLDSGWDGRQPVCEAVKCSPPTAIQNGKFDPVEDIYVYNQAVTYTCQANYTLDGAQTVTCSNNGTFVPAPPRCVFVECETPNITNAVRVEGPPPPYGYKHFVRYQCNEGYTMNGSAYLVCEIDGWSSSPPVCRRIEPTTPPPSDGNVMKPSIIITIAVVTVVLLGPKYYHSG